MVTEALIFYRQDEPTAELKAQHFNAVSLPVLKTLEERFAAVAWQAPELGALVKAVAAEAGVKMGQVGMPLRLALFGTTHTPSIDATLALLGREETLRRLANALS
jgi:glutamyl-tRNA synthetase